MSWPTSQDYFEAVQNPRLNFGDPELRQGKARTSSLGLPQVMSGNFADVYPIECPGNRVYAVKCFTREVTGQRDRYREISSHLQQARLPFTVEFSYLDGEQGIRIRGAWYPVLKMEWVEGSTLNQFVGDHVREPQTLEALGQLWVQLAQRLRDARLTHADLQHGNVLLVQVPGAKTGTVKLKLIDYDGMYIPALASRPSGEMGHVNYQHPGRIRDQVYSAEVDRFPHLLICTALRCLMAGGRGLWDRHDNGDNLLFRQSDFEFPGSSPLLSELWKLPDPGVQSLVGRLLLAARGSLGQEPHVGDLLSNGQPPPLSTEQAKQVAALLSHGPSRPPPPPPRISSPVAAGAGIVVACACGQRFLAQSHLAGKSVPCPECGRMIFVPESGSATGAGLTTRIAKPWQAVRNLPQQKSISHLWLRFDQSWLRRFGVADPRTNQLLLAAAVIGVLAVMGLPVLMALRPWNRIAVTKAPDPPVIEQAVQPPSVEPPRPIPKVSVPQIPKPESVIPPIIPEVVTRPPLSPADTSPTVDRHAQLLESQEQSLAAGNLRAALDATEELAKLDGGDGLVLKMNLLVKRQTQISTAEDYQVLAVEMLALVNQSVSTGRTDLAKSHLDQVLLWSRRSKNYDLEREATLLVLKLR